jgi:DNA-directed RNA polymerase subunit RPC12/RpoP
MPITYHCQRCGRSGKAKDELAGRIVKCPGCDASIEMPGAPKVTAPPLPPVKDLGAEIDAYFAAEPGPPPPPPPSYAVGDLPQPEQPESAGEALAWREDVRGQLQKIVDEQARQGKQPSFPDGCVAHGLTFVALFIGIITVTGSLASLVGFYFRDALGKNEIWEDPDIVGITFGAIFLAAGLLGLASIARGNR